MKKRTGNYGSAPDRGLFNPSTLAYFAWSRQPLVFLLIHVAAILVPVFLGIDGVGTSAVWVVAPLTILAILLGYWFYSSQHRNLLRNKWQAQLTGDIMHKYFGWDQDKWTTRQKDMYRAAALFVHRYPWMYTSSAMGLEKSTQTIIFKWTNGAGDVVELSMGRTIIWSVIYADTQEHEAPDDNGNWDYEFAPPASLISAFKLVSP